MAQNSDSHPVAEGPCARRHDDPRSWFDETPQAALKKSDHFPKFYPYLQYHLMGTSFQSIFCAGLLLLMCRIWLDVQCVNRQVLDFDNSIGWTAQAGEEEDSKEFEDDDDTGDITPPSPYGMSIGMLFRSEPFDSSEHIQEVVPPPPQV